MYMHPIKITDSPDS